MKNKEKSSNIPNLRFPEFSGEWKSFILKDIVNILPTNSLSWDDLNYDNKNIKNIHYGLLHKKNKSIMFSSDNDIPYINEDVDTNKFNFLITGDFILVDTSENRCDLGKSVEVIIDDNNQIVSGLHTFHLRDISNLFFIGFKSYLFQTENIKKQLYKIAIGSKIFSITKKDLLNIKMIIPPINEQKKIVTTLKLIDNLIETQSKIINNLIIIKKILIRKYFSDNDDWNVYELSDILSEHKTYEVKNNNYSHATLGKKGVFPKNERYNRDNLVKNENKKYKVTFKNDICYNPANLKFGVITRNNYKDCLISPIYITYRVNKNYSSKFIELLVTRKEFINNARKYEEGTVYERMAVKSKDFLSLKIKLPSLEKQILFADFVDKFDEIIELEEKILKNYELLKKFLIINLFI